MRLPWSSARRGRCARPVHQAALARELARPALSAARSRAPDTPACTGRAAEQAPAGLVVGQHAQRRDDVDHLGRCQQAAQPHDLDGQILRRAAPRPASDLRAAPHQHRRCPIADRAGVPLGAHALGDPLRLALDGFDDGLRGSAASGSGARAQLDVASPRRSGCATAFAARSTVSSLRQLVASGNRDAGEESARRKVAVKRPMLPALAPRHP